MLGGYVIRSEVRCIKCNKKLFIGEIGFDIYGKPKIVEVKCPRCGVVNVITCEIEEKVIVRVKE